MSLCTQIITDIVDFYFLDLGIGYQISFYLFITSCYKMYLNLFIQNIHIRFLEFMNYITLVLKITLFK